MDPVFVAMLINIVVVLFVVVVVVVVVVIEVMVVMLVEQYVHNNVNSIFTEHSINDFVVISILQLCDHLSIICISIELKANLRIIQTISNITLTCSDMQIKYFD
uniref:Uncharacterized protein n=1 Tax=Glossina brevipalpis TaxID=37001 RepID=A0A1A9W461_9MUSC